VNAMPAAGKAATRACTLHIGAVQIVALANPSTLAEDLSFKGILAGRHGQR